MTETATKEIKRKIRFSHYASCHYSTSQQPKDDSKFFWEDSKLDEADPRASKKPIASSDSRDFHDLLGALFDETLNAKDPFVPSKIQPPSRSRPAESIIEKKLLELVEKGSYKSKSPIPKVMEKPFFRSGDEDVKEEDNRTILDEVEPFDYNWYKERIVNDERVRMKEKEMLIKESIVGSETVYGVLDVISKEIDQASYPPYYHSVVKTALEHTSRSDPYLTLSIFEQIKAKSIQSYIKGCTTETYNTILMMRWETWRDVHGMLDLLEEMSLNGIKVNSETRSIVGKVVTEIEEEKDIDYANKQGLFWNMDERRSCNIMKQMANKWLLKK